MVKLKRFIAIGILLFIMPSFAAGNDPPEKNTKSATQSNYKLRTSVMGNAGTPIAGGEYQSKGTLGQSTPIGIAAASDDTLYAGFWKSYLMMIPTAVTEIPEPLVNRLYQNFPNPFNPTTTIKYSVAKKSPVQLTIYNVAGQVVKSLVNENKPKGRYKTVWDGTNTRGEAVASGVYFYLLRIGTFSDAKKMLILK